MIRMGKSSKTKEPETRPETYEPVTQPAVSLTSDTKANAFSESELMARDIKEGRMSGFVGGGTVLTGETTFNAMLRIDGHLKGSVSSEEGTLIIGSTGQVDADITVASAVINGAVNGDVIASEKLTLGRTARVVGDIHAPRLIIEDGATLEGSCSMLQSREILESRVAESEQAYTLSNLEIVDDTDEDEELTDSSTYSSETEIDDADDEEEDLEENAEAATF